MEPGRLYLKQRCHAGAHRHLAAVAGSAACCRLGHRARLRREMKLPVPALIVASLFIPTWALIVHGGTGDRSRWTPLLPLFAAHFRACAMDRRGHGQSEAGGDYSLTREFEDIVGTLQVPTLLLSGSKTASPQLKQAITSLMDTLPR